MSWSDCGNRSDDPDAVIRTVKRAGDGPSKRIPLRRSRRPADEREGQSLLLVDPFVQRTDAVWRCFYDGIGPNFQRQFCPILGSGSERLLQALRHTRRPEHDQGNGPSPCGRVIKRKSPFLCFPPTRLLPPLPPLPPPHLP